MLDRYSKKLFKVVYKHLRGKDGYIKFEYLYKMVNDKLNISESDAKGCVNCLANQEYLEFAKSPTGNNVGVRLTYKGNHKKEFSWMAFKQYMRNNWVAIAAITISIAAFIKSFFFNA